MPQSRSAALRVAAAVAALVALALPDIRSADGRTLYEAYSGRTPAERALSGGVVLLRAPGEIMIRVRSSTFRMGSSAEDVVEATTTADCSREPATAQCDESRFAPELPAHFVTLSSYLLDRTEVTLEAYRRCVAVRRCAPLPYGEGARRFERPRYPVVLVTYEEAEAYCRFREARLPTEAEFERAARGPEGRRYPWGDVYNSRASNHGRLGVDPTFSFDARDGFAELAPVGSFPAGRTPEGFLDLAGNVAEWVGDRYMPGYSEGAVTNPIGPSAPPAGSERVVRGGNYEDGSPSLRGAARSFDEPTARRTTLGFRCAKSVRGKGVRG